MNLRHTLQASRQKLLEQGLFYALIALPLLYFPENSSRAHFYRFVVFISATGLSLGLIVRRATISSLPRALRVFLVIAVVAVVLTWCLNLSLPWPVHYVGIPLEYLGYITWLTFLVAAALFRETIRKLMLSPTTLVLCLAGLVLSLWSGSYYIRHGLSLSGVFYQPLALAIYANLGVVLCLEQLRRVGRKRKPRLALGLALTVAIGAVLASQSLLGYMLLAINLILWIFFTSPQRSLRYGLVAVVLGIICLPTLAPNYMSNYRRQSVRLGLDYKADLYKSQIPDLLHNHPLSGHGPESLGTTVDNTDYLPPDISKSIGANYGFSANHDLFFDVGYFFGVIAALGLLVLNVLAVKSYLQDQSRSIAYLLVYEVLLVGSIFTMPSIELTSLYFLVLFGLFRTSTNSTGK